MTPRKTQKKIFLNPDSAEREYTRLLQRLSRSLQTDINLVLLPQLGAISRQFNVEMKSDSWVDTIDSLFAELARLAERSLQVVFSKVPGQFTAVSKFNDKQFKMVVKANTGLKVPEVMPGAPSASLLGVSVFRSEPYLEPLAQAWVRENTDLIKTLPTRLHGELEGIVRRGVSNGISVRGLTEQIKARYGVTNYRATLIAQDQTLKLNADLTQYRLQSVGVRKYIWRTVGDSRVRDDHVQRNGKTYTWDKPPSGGLAPGREVRCRCHAEAVWDAEDADSEPIKQIQQATPTTWKPTMTKVEADKWAANSVVKEPIVHYTSKASANAISKEGFSLKGFGSGAGDAFSRGVYTVPNSSFATKSFYAREIGGSPLKMIANVQKVHEVTLDYIALGKAVSNGKAVTQFSGMNIDQIKASVLHGIKDAPSKLERALIKTSKKGFGGMMIPDVDEAITQVLKNEGFDAVRISNPKFNEGIGGDQLIVFDPKNVTVIK